MFKHVLVPHDGSELSMTAVEKSIVFAKETGARLTFLYGLPELPLPASGVGDDARYDPGRPKRFLEEAMEDRKSVV